VNDLQGDLLMTFNIHNQQAEQIYMAGGDQTFISGPGAQVLLEDTRRLRQQLHQLNLRPEALTAAEHEIDGMDEELSASRPNKSALAGRLRNLTQLLQGVGALATAGEALRAPLENLAHWFGI
jgi:hypothetical protein